MSCASEQVLSNPAAFTWHKPCWISPVITKAMYTRAGFCVGWLLAVAVGFTFIMRYESAQGASGKAPGEWPQESKIVRQQNRPSLIMFAHPKCPCTRASVEELNRLLAQTSQVVSPQVWFFKPLVSTTDWMQTELSQMAASIPGVEVHEDIEGVEGRRFGAQTSGYVLLYDKDGRLVFQGGITGGRGHIGNNEAEQALLSILDKGGASMTQWPVYGCSVITPCEQVNETGK